MTREKVEARVAARLRTLRRERGLTLDAVARVAGVSKSLLSKIENARVSSPLATYARVAAAVGATLGDLVDGASDRACILVRRAEHEATARRDARLGHVFETLGYKRRDKRMEPVLVTYPAGSEEAPRHTHAGEEFVYLLKGRMEFVHGAAHFVLTAGDALYLDGGIPHGGRALGRTASVAIVVTA